MKYLIKRKRIYQFERPVPRDVQQIIGKKLWRTSLRTDSKTEAEIKCRRKTVETDELIQSARNGSFRKASPYDMSLVALSWSNDFQLFNRERIAKAAFPNVWKLEAPIGDQAEYPIIGNRRELSIEVLSWLKKNDFCITCDTPEYEELLDACHDHYIVSNPQIAKESPETIDAASRNTYWPSKPMHHHNIIPARILIDPSLTISQLYKRYLVESDSITESTQQEFGVSVRRFIELIGDVDVNSITRKHAEEYRLNLCSFPVRPKNIIRGLPFPKQVEWAKQNGAKTLQANTVNKNLLAISLVLKFAFSMTSTIADRSWKNPFEGFIRKPKKTARKPIKPFTPEQIWSIFSEPAFKMKTPENFWIPLVLYYTGARLDEISQAHATDVVTGKVTYIIVENLDDDDPIIAKKVKTLSSNRYIPIRTELIELGFIDYVNAIKAAEHIHLFPDLSHYRKRKRGDKVSRAFIKSFRKLGEIEPDTGLNTKRLVTHSLRHTFRITGFRHANQDLIKVVMGHLVEGVSFQVYGSEIYKMPDVLKTEVIDKMCFPKVDMGFLKLQAIRHLKTINCGLSDKPSSGVQ